VGVVGLAVGNRLVSSGVSVHQTAGIVAAAFLPFSFEFLWAPIMTAIGTGAASTKAAALWSLANFASAYPTAIEGVVHDRNGTSAMLLTDAGLGAVGFGLLILATRLLPARADGAAVKSTS